MRRWFRVRTVIFTARHSPVESSNWGTIFQITTNGTFTNLFSFTGANNPYLGANPGAALVPASDGSFYGTADYGGAYANYRPAFMARATAHIPINHQWHGASSGLLRQHQWRPILPAGWCWGGMAVFMAQPPGGGKGISGSFPGYGTVFKMTPDGTLTNIYLFTGSSDGGFIYAGLVQGSDGNLYGAAFSGGSQGYGTLFKVSTNGSFTLLHTFTLFRKRFAVWRVDGGQRW